MAKKNTGTAAQAAAADIAASQAADAANPTTEETTGMDTNTTNPHEDKPNDTRLEDGVKLIRELGRDAALGKDSLPKLAFQVTKMAAEGVIDKEMKYEGEAVSDKSGKSTKRKYDDAEFLFNEYSKAEGKKAIHERSLGGAKANISKLRQFVAFGMLNTCDPQDVLERAAAVRKQMIVDSKKVKSAYAAYIDVAREQQKPENTADLTNEALEQVIAKPEKASPELRKILDSVFKRLEKLCTDGIDGVTDTSDYVVNAANSIRDRLAEIDAANQPDQTDEEVEAGAETALAQLGSRDNEKLAAMLAKLGYGKVTSA